MKKEGGGDKGEVGRVVRKRDGRRERNEQGAGTLKGKRRRLREVRGGRGRKRYEKGNVERDSRRENVEGGERARGGGECESKGE